MTVVTAQYSVAPMPATVNLSSNSATSSVATATKPSTAVSSVVKKCRSTCEPMRLAWKATRRRIGTLKNPSMRDGTRTVIGAASVLMRSGAD